MTTRLVLQKIQFYGDTLVGRVATGGLADGNVLFPFRRLCEGVGVNRQSQERALRASAWATSYKVSLVAADGKTYLTTCVDLGTPPGWLMMLKANDVRHAAVRDKSMLSKEESVDEERSADADEENLRWRGRRPIDRRTRRQPGAWKTDVVEEDVAPADLRRVRPGGSSSTRKAAVRRGKDHSWRSIGGLPQGNWSGAIEPPGQGTPLTPRRKGRGGVAGLGPLA